MPSLCDHGPPFVADRDFVLYVGDVRDTLDQLPAGSVDCCVTSPPYWGLRDYGHEGQIGLERSPGEYVDAMVAVFGGVRRVLSDQGTLWLNLGDSYNAYNGGAGPGSKLSKTQTEQRPQLASGFGIRAKSLKPKDLCGIPWRVALALQEDGWWLRSDIVWSKPNPMPESITDRPTKSHEYVFLLAKSERYFFDQDAVREPFAPASEDRYRYAFGGPKAEDLHRQDAAGPGGNRTAPIGKREFPTWSDRKAAGATRGNVAFEGNVGAGTQRGVHGEGISHDLGDPGRGRNIRSVWEITTQPYPDAHFATFPIELPRRCIAAGCPAGGTVLDPFMGSGTTALAARGLGRKRIGIELNPEYAALCARRLAQQSLLAEDEDGRQSGERPRYARIQVRDSQARPTPTARSALRRVLTGLSP